MNDKRDSFEHSLKQALHDHEDGIDELTLARIRAARANAVDAARQRKTWYWYVPASVAATITLAFGIVLLIHEPNKDPATAELALFEDIEILSNTVSLKVLEDLELYEWLDGNADISA